MNGISLELLAFSLLIVLAVGLMALLTMGIIDVQSFKELELAILGIIAGILGGVGVGMRLALARKETS